MASFDSINYSLRPNKQIERGLAFEGVRRLRASMGIDDQVYVGFGSVWFADFHMAHKLLKIDDMRSMEKHPIGFARARFNRPFRTVQVINETSRVGLPILFADAAINNRPWMIWLDYDSAMDAGIVDDIRDVIENAPPNSIFLVTLSATPNAYGKLRSRGAFLRGLLGDVVPDDLTEEAVSPDRFEATLADLLMPFMQGVAASVGRAGGFQPGFRMIYRDTATMVTIGGVLPRPGSRTTVRAEVLKKDWPCLVDMRIEAPHLTMKESIAIQTELPRQRSLTRRQIGRLGFDLEEMQIASFQKFYRFYPTFAQIAV